MIQLDWEEGLFRGLQRAWSFMRRTDSNDNPHRVMLEEVQSRCRILSQLVSGRPTQILPSEGVGGTRGTIILLPSSIGLAQTRQGNLNLYLMRTIIAALMVPTFTTARKPWLQRLEFLKSLEHTLIRANAQFPQFLDAFNQALSCELEHRIPPTSLSPLARDFELLRRRVLSGEGFDLVSASHHFSGSLPPDLPAGPYLCGDSLTAMEELRAQQAEQAQLGAAPPQDGHEAQAPPKDHIVRTLMPRVDQVEPLPMHTFEKTETLETYKGGSRNVDGDDELEQHLEALEELDLREIVRGGSQTQGLYKAELDLGGEIPDVNNKLPGEVGCSYPEWNDKQRRYRPDWVTVFSTPVRAEKPGDTLTILNRNHGLIRRLKRQLSAQREKNCRLTRQLDGDDIDLEAVVNARADRRAGQDPGEKLYCINRKLRRDMAVSLLFDISLSAGSWIEGRRVLDVTREAVLILGEVAISLGDQLRIQCFASNTRNHCRVFDLKNWQEPWAKARGRILALEPQGYTRIGPALRHAYAGFKGVQAKNQLLLLITDGKPTDYDRYEGTYGMQDIKKAISEGHDLGIRSFALALDPKAGSSLPIMFGQSGWQVLRHLNDLPTATVQAYSRLSN